MPLDEFKTENARALVVINRRSGTVRSRGAKVIEALVEAELSKHFASLDVVLVDGNILPRVERAVAEDSHDIIIAGGGDGTIASVAQLLLDTDYVMGALPLGTMNLFVQAIGFRPRLEEALAQYRETEIEKIDVGFANDRVFLHQVSFGLQPRMARLRERRGYRSRIGKMIGAAAALFALALKPPVVRVMARIDGESQRIVSPMLAVTNNPVGSDKHWSVQHRLDGGVLGFYALNEFSLKTIAKLMLKSLTSRNQDDGVISQKTVQSVKLRRAARSGMSKRLTNRRPRITASIDGEVIRLTSPISISIRPRCLSVLARVEKVRDCVHDRAR